MSSPIYCIGSMLWDVIGQAQYPLRSGADAPGDIIKRPGGVAYNIARALRQYRLPVSIVSAVGMDLDGDALIQQARAYGMDTTHILRRKDIKTDRYIAIENADGELFGAIADTRALEKIGDMLIHSLKGKPLKGIVVLDGNLSPSLISYLTTSPMLRSANVRIVPASPAKAPRMIGLIRQVPTTIYANLAEANAMTEGQYARAQDAALALCRGGAKAALVTDGARDAAFARTDQDNGPHLFGATPPPVIARSVTGAGDMLVAAHIAAEMAGKSDWDALHSGLEAAARHISGG